MEIKLICQSTLINILSSVNCNVYLASFFCSCPYFCFLLQLGFLKAFPVLTISTFSEPIYNTTHQRKGLLAKSPDDFHISKQVDTFLSLLYCSIFLTILTFLFFLISFYFIFRKKFIYNKNNTYSLHATWKIEKIYERKCKSHLYGFVSLYLCVLQKPQT